MKKIMFALCLLGGSVVLVNAQDTQDTTSNQYRTETPSQTMPGEPSQNQDALGQSQDQNRERIQSTELPDAVKRSLEGQEYRGWLVNGAYKATGASDASSSSSAMESDTTSTDASQTQGDNSAVGAQAEEIYIVELKNGAQTKTIRFDKDGKKLEGMDEGMEGQEGMQGQTSPNGETSPDNQSNQSESADPNQSQSTESQSSEPQSGQTETQTESTQPDQNSSTSGDNSSSSESSSTTTESSSTTTEKDPQ